MKNNFLIFFVSEFLLIIKCKQYSYETIEEIIPKSSSLYFPNSYRIYEYIPLYNKNLNNTKSIYIKIYANSRLDIYIYDNYSKIEQDKYGDFINYIDSMSGENDFKKLEDLNYDKNYYFVLFNWDVFDDMVQPIDYQFFILDEINNNIQLNPSLSNDFNFFQTSDKPMNFNYKYEKNKIALIRLVGKIKLQIFENDKIIYNHNIKDNYKILNYTFIKENEYKIIFEDLSNSSEEKSTIYFQFFDDEKYLKYNLAQSSLILFDKYDYFIEVDISKYHKGENIFFLFFVPTINIKYQYKNDLKKNNLINLGTFSFITRKINYIRIKKEKDDDNLIIYINIYNLFDRYNKYYKSINILKYKVEEITTNDNILIINEDKVLYLDYFNFNKYDSFGFYSNQSFLFLEQMITNDIKFNYCEKKNLKIIKKEIFTFYNIKNALIFFNKELNNIFPLTLELKKFTFPIIYKNTGESFLINSCESFNQYLPLSKNNELYFYLNHKYLIDVFLPLSGKYETYFLNENDIKTLSDFDFDKNISEKNYICGEYSGYLKIKNINNDFSMFHHFSLYTSDSYEQRQLDTGKKYHFLIKNLIENKYNITIKSSYVGKKIFLKFRIFGLNQNKTIIMFFDEKEYKLNSESIEIIYEYKKYNPNLIHFKNDITDKISKHVFIEIKLGFLQEDLNLYKQIDFKDAIGKITYDKYNGTIIKISRDFDKELFNYILVINNEESNIQITYDTLTYAIPMGNYKKKEMFPLIELFKSNPYSKELNDTNKYFFITIYGGREFLIKKEKSYSDTPLEFNKINIIPELINENKKYFYKIKLPKGDYNYIEIQTLNNNKYNYISLNNAFYRVLNNFYYESYYDSFKDEKEQTLFINYFDSDINNYINLIPKREYDFDNMNKNNYVSDINYVKQVGGKNKIEINASSLAYNNYPNKYNYYLFLNINCTNLTNLYENIFKYISGFKKQDSSKKEKIIIFEDDGSQERIIYETDIAKEDLHSEINDSDNSYFIIPVNKNNNLIEYYGYFNIHFNFIYIENKSKVSYLPYYIAAGIIAAFIIIAVIIIVVYKRKKNKNKEIIDKLNEDKFENINN